MDSWTKRLFENRPLTPYDGYLSASGMIIGAASLTIASFSFLPSSSSSSSSSGEALVAFAWFVFLVSLVWLLCTARRLGASVWNLLFWGNSCGGGAFGLAIFCLGMRAQMWKFFASAMWGWVVGVLVSIWSERDLWRRTVDAR